MGPQGGLMRDPMDGLGYDKVSHMAQAESLLVDHLGGMPDFEESCVISVVQTKILDLNLGQAELFKLQDLSLGQAELFKLQDLSLGQAELFKLQDLSLGQGELFKLQDLSLGQAELFKLQRRHI
ncbi:hypothetical protein NDU88_007162 [Pleurodeles waltl]|uniref:Uncharacterized protein n=1 Tax=Pleurodeles waltl TaxID=8319 RepID=A0AAV7SS02_PLEWA|nr:hypothetical protein NDU88_007162 [Pleurodeles waltl]